MAYICDHIDLESDEINVWREVGESRKKSEPSHWHEVTEEQLALWVLKGKRLMWADQVGDQLR